MNLSFREAEVLTQSKRSKIRSFRNPELLKKQLYGAAAGLRILLPDHIGLAVHWV